MKKNNPAKRGPHDSNQLSSQPDKIGWIRKYCGKGIFREIWKNRFVVLKGDQLYIAEKEVKDEKKIQEVFDLADYERSEELRKSNSRSKKNHSKFILLRCRQPGNTVPNLVFLAVSPEEKESWISVLNGAITRAKNHILDEVTVEEDSLLAHPTRDRVKIPHTRRLPTRGHLMAVASTSTSDGMLTLDLVQEEDVSASEQKGSCEKSFGEKLDKSVMQPDVVSPRSDAEIVRFSKFNETKGKVGSAPHKNEIVWDIQEQLGQSCTSRTKKKMSADKKNRCASMDEILSCSDSRTPKGAAAPASAAKSSVPVSQLQELISQKLQRTEELLTNVRGQARKGKDSPSHKDSENSRAEAERLLQEAASAWSQAREVLDEVKEIQVLYQKLNLSASTPSPSQGSNHRNLQQTHRPKSKM